MIGKGLAVAGLGFGASLVVLPPWRRRVDYYVFRHYRNWRENLDDPNRFQTQEEFYEMLGNVTHGFKELLTGEAKAE